MTCRYCVGGQGAGRGRPGTMASESVLKEVRQGALSRQQGPEAGKSQEATEAGVGGGELGGEMASLGAGPGPATGHLEQQRGTSARVTGSWSV